MNQSNVLEKTITHWSNIAEILSVPSSEEKYQVLIGLFDQLIDRIGEDEEHPLTNLLEILAILIESYEEIYLPALNTPSSVEILDFLMEENGLTQSDLPEIGSQGVVSEILRGKRQLNTRQIKALSERFKVSPKVFF